MSERQRDTTTATRTVDMCLRVTELEYLDELRREFHVIVCGTSDGGVEYYHRNSTVMDVEANHRPVESHEKL